MAKNRSKRGKNKNDLNKGGAMSIDVSTDAVPDAPQPMDMSEGKNSNSFLGAIDRKIKKAGRVTRSKNLRKLKRVAKAITKNEKGEEKQLKMKSKTQRVQSAKTLYE
ncbi:uncharacterized protein LOC141822287 [Curcuma longa]|uniref:uncharacterized protein LOC141822287 n=1 Tax=Curcuma longa TaxID=136217 RepID=UPI003D9F9BA8